MESFDLGSLEDWPPDCFHLTGDDEAEGLVPVTGHRIENRGIAAHEKTPESKIVTQKADMLAVSLKSGSIDLRGLNKNLPSGLRTMVVGRLDDI